MAERAFASAYYLARPAQHDAYDLSSPFSPVSPLMSRAESLAGDGLSVVSGVTATLPNYLVHVRPAPEYISHASAAQVADEAHDARRGRSSSDDEDVPADRNGRAAVAESAVATVNAFLDKLLFDFLATARTTSLLALRPAVADVLKKSLARDAIATADANLEDLLALQEEDSDDDDDDGDDGQSKASSPSNNKWNLEFIWKRSRLRVMMRSEKSEFDIDDDERCVQDEGLLMPGRRFSQTAGVISLSAEIFLAGVLDYIGEQLLSLATVSASARTRRRASISRATSGVEGITHVLVQESDVEKAALNSAMDRLWRVWRKSLRARGLIPGRGRRLSGASRTSVNGSTSPSITRGGSGDSGVFGTKNNVPNIPDMRHREHILASNTALPMTPRDIDDLEIPTPTEYHDNRGSQDKTSIQEHSPRTKSGNRTTWTGATGYFYDPFRRQQDAGMQRPTSQPTPMATPFVDAPGAWPVETPRPATSDQKEMSQLEKVKRLQAEAVLDPSYDDMKTPTAERSSARASKVPTLDPSQLESDSEFNSRSSSIIPSYYDEPDIKTPPSEKRRARAINMASGISAAAIAAAMDSIHGSKQPGSLQQPPFDFSEDNDQRKSLLLDMKGLISGRDSAQENHRPEHHSTTGAPTELHHQGSGGSSHTNTTYDLTNPTKMHAISEIMIPERTARTGTGSESNPGTPTKKDSSLLQSAEIDNVSSSKNPHRPPRLDLTNTPPNGNEDGPRTAEKDQSTSPRNFLIRKQLSGALTPTSPTSPRSPRSPNSNMRSFSRQSSDEFHQSAPIMKQRVSIDSFRSRKASKGIGAEPSSPSTRGGARPFTNDRVASISMDEAGRPGSNKLTSASITSTEDFDALIQNHNTVKYTLTPESVRDLPTKASPYNRSIHSVSKSKLNDSSENIASVGSAKKPAYPTIDTDVDNVRLSRAETRSPARSALPKDKQKQLQEQRKASKERRRSISRPAAKNVKSTSGGHLPREPTFGFTSLFGHQSGERSVTGWFGAPRPDQTVAEATRKSASITSGRSPMIGAGKSPSIGFGKSPRLGPGKSPSIGPGASPSLGSRKSSLVPREANGSPSIGSNGELIDFIRNGPNQPGERRIPKDIAPFHHSGDHDDMTNSGSGIPPPAITGTNNDSSKPLGRINGSSSISSTVGSRTESTRDSHRGSVSSNTALLPNAASNGQTVQFVSQPPRTSNLKVPGGSSPAFGIERKRHRNKDPYPIDDSEDEDYLAALPADRKPDQSLVDFLSQNEPPANNAPAPLAVSGTAQARAMINKARATSVNSLRQATAQNESSTTNSKASTLSPTTPISPMSPTQSLAGRGAQSGYEPSIASVNTSTSNATARPAHITSQVTSATDGPHTRRPNTSKPRMEIRSAGNTKTARLGAFEQTSTNDLADFLRSSGPPPELSKASAPAPAPVMGADGSKFDKKKGGKFWKKKTYTDMP
ncbi:hypothetical protein MBLNU459_g6324t2 [Dothideomycetes sp. NU459]